MNTNPGYSQCLPDLSSPIVHHALQHFRVNILRISYVGFLFPHAMNIPITSSCLVLILAGCTGRGEQPGHLDSIPRPETTAVAPASTVDTTSAGRVTARPDLAEFFQKYGVEGCFILYNLHADTYLRYNPQRCDQGFLPASTFKIFNSLVALESGVAPDENMVLRWDGVKRGGAWDQDHDMRMAFKNSTVWYYQEIARRIGEERMRYYLNREKYGNRSTEGGIDKFWLSGGLRITPNEQIDFLKRLYAGKLGFSPATMSTVRDIMKMEETPRYTMRGKTGWAPMDSIDIGWIVGWIEKPDTTYFFTLNIATREKDFPMREARKDILDGILKELGII